MEPVDESMSHLIKMKRWAVSTVNGYFTALSHVDRQIQSDLFANGTIPESPKNSRSATTESKFVEGLYLAFLIVSSILIVCVVLACLMGLWALQRRRAFRRQQENMANVERELGMMHMGRPRDLTPRPSTASIVRVSPQRNVDRAESQINQPTGTATSTEVADPDLQKAPNELLVTAMVYEAKDSSKDEANEPTVEMMTFSTATGFVCKWENKDGEIVGEGMEKNVADEKDGGEMKPDEFLLKQQAQKGFSASA